MLAKSANTLHNYQLGRNAGNGCSLQPSHSPISPGTSVPGDSLSSQLGDVAGSCPGTSAKGNSSNSQPGDATGSDPGASDPGDSAIFQLGDVAGSAWDQVVGPRVITMVVQP